MPAALLKPHLNAGEAFNGLGDFLSVANNENLRKFLQNAEGEVRVLFSEEVGKINEAGFYQKRNFIVTPQNVYNFKGDSFDMAQRRIPIRQLDGLVVSNVSQEVVLQVSGEHDYHIDFTHHKTRQRDAFVTVVTREFERLSGFHLVPQVAVRLTLHA